MSKKIADELREVNDYLDQVHDHAEQSRPIWEGMKDRLIERYQGQEFNTYEDYKGNYVEGKSKHFTVFIREFQTLFAAPELIEYFRLVGSNEFVMGNNPEVFNAWPHESEYQKMVESLPQISKILESAGRPVK